jgi:hypothetical protein
VEPTGRDAKTPPVVTTADFIYLRFIGDGSMDKKKDFEMIQRRTGQDKGGGILGIDCKEGSKGQQESKKRNNRCSKDNHYAVASDPAQPTTYLEKCLV